MTSPQEVPEVLLPDPPPIPDDENVHGETEANDGTPGVAPPGPPEEAA